jgi:hypothetical protein
MHTRGSIAAVFLTVFGSSLSCLSALAADDPCQQIRQACTGAGFVEGGGKQGNGVVVDCINPIMQAAAQPANASKPLPTVDPTVVSACKAAKPNYPQWPEIKSRLACAASDTAEVQMCCGPASASLASSFSVDDLKMSSVM